MGKKILIVGGVAGGATAAARMRRLDETAEIIILEKGEYVSFANCGLPYYIGDVIKERENLTLQTPQSFKKRFNVDVRVRNEVLSIDREKKELEILDKDTGKTYRESYDKLILSPGAEPIRPKLPGIESNKIFTLRNIPDTYAIKDYAQKKGVTSAAIIGGGYIGIEVAENLKHLGLNVTVIEALDHVIPIMDFDMAQNAHQELLRSGVELLLNERAAGFEETGEKINVKLESGKVRTVDMVILSIGVRPEVKLAREAGLELGVTGGIKTDETMLTSDPEIYAVGDAVEVTSIVDGRPALIALASPANKQGRIVADNIAGRKEKYGGTLGVSILKIFSMNFAMAGLSEKALQKAGLPYEKVFTVSQSHASYYPLAQPMVVKTLFNKETGKLYGAQIAGFEGTDKRIDIFATALMLGLTVKDLTKLELAYAPPFSSAKDPVNMAGYVASNVIDGLTHIFHWHDVEKLVAEGGVLLDVRTKEEYEMGTIGNAINIPVDELRSRLNELPKGKKLLVFCQIGLRGYVAGRMLTAAGFDMLNLSGGYKIYDTATAKIINKERECPVLDCGKPVDGGFKVEMKNEVKLDIDACGLQCPGPIMQVFNGLSKISEGEMLRIKATDPGFATDIGKWCERTGNTLHASQFDNGAFVAEIVKGNMDVSRSEKVASANNDKTIIVFSGDLDKVIASFIIANGAAAMGRKVTMFFTFWGLNVLRKKNKVRVKKTLVENMFGMMMPRGTTKLSLSKLNMMGMGTAMMRGIMKKKGVYSLEELVKKAIEAGIEIIACNMSMDIMGIHEEELIEGVRLAGVASYLGAAETADTNLFI
jgi:NADPH-dependent 2,4-dienoyl-CoA reductase/sulfur reductase-like enzyme/peroxiredoxin family protein/rhodanese-related sulfurtransferase/TusA-related sulfurtransferase